VGVGDAPVVIGHGKAGVEADSLVVIFNGSLKLAQVIVGAAPVGVGQGIVSVLRRIASS
jgi:hypothetical protein